MENREKLVKNINDVVLFVEVIFLVGDVYFIKNFFFCYVNGGRR